MLNFKHLEIMEALKFFVSDKQVNDFVDFEKQDNYTIYECKEIPGIYFLGSDNANPHTEPFEDLDIDEDDLIRIISDERYNEISILIKDSEVEYE